MKSKISSVLAGVFLFVMLIIPVDGSGQSASEVFKFAENLKRDQLYEAASQQFLTFAMENPNNELAPRALEQAAECFIELESFDEAIRVLESLLGTYIDDPRRCRNQLLLGRVYYRSEKFEEANLAFSNILISDAECPQQLEAMLGKGEAILALSRYSEAKGIFGSLIENYDDPKILPKAYLDLAIACIGLNENENAIAAFDRLITDYPTHPLSAFASLEAARLHTQVGDPEAAVTAYQRARRFEEKAIFIPACTEGAAALEELGRFDEALAWYKDVLARKDAGDVRNVLGDAMRAAFFAGDYQTVVSLHARYQQQYPDSFSPPVVYYKTKADLKLSNYEQALAGARSLEIRAPGSGEAVESAQLKGEALLGMGKTREALGELRRFVSTAGDSTLRVAALDKMADVYMNTVKDTAQALEILLEKVEVENRRNLGEVLEVASMFETVGDYKGAVRLYDELLFSFPFAPEAKQARARLRYIESFCVFDPVAAAREMDRVARDIIQLPKPEAMLELARGRMEIMKDYGGALALLDQALDAAQGGEVRTKALYYKGACHAALARKAHAEGQESDAGSASGEAVRIWDSIIAQSDGSSWAAKASFEKLFLQTVLTGEVDTMMVLNTISRHPARSERAEALVMLAEYYGRRPGTASLRNEVRYYQQALAVPGGLDDPVHAQLALAEALSRLGRHRESLELSRSVLEDERRSIHLRAAYQAGISLRQLGEYREAAMHFQEVSGGDATGAFGARAQLQVADCHFLLKEFEGALTEYQAALRRAADPQFRWEVNYRLSLCQEKLGHGDAALKLMDECIASPYGGNLRVHAYRHAIGMARSQGKNAKVGTLLEALAEEAEDRDAVWEANRDLIRWYLMNDRPEDAVKRTAVLITQVPAANRLEAQALQVMAYYRAGRTAEAKRYHEALSSALPSGSPLEQEVQLHAAWHHYDNTQYKQAIALLRPVAGDCPENAPCEEMMYLLTMSLFSDNQIKPASDLAGEFLSKYPFSAYAPAIHLKFGNALSAREQYSGALVHYQEAAAAAKDSSVAFNALKNTAIAYQKMLKWREAGDVWAQLAETFPGSPEMEEIRLGMARCKMEGGDLGGAIIAYQAAIPFLTEEGQARAYYWSGECHQKLGDYKAAVVQYLKVPYLVPREAMWGVTAQLKAAECYANMDRLDSAKSLYEKIIRQHGRNSQWGSMAAKAIEQIDGTSQGEPQSEGEN